MKLLFIDSQVTAIASLLNGLLPDIQAIVLNDHQDGIAQISSVLQQHPEIQTLHIVSHGSPGCLYLGNGELNLTNIYQYQQLLQHWNIKNIVLYGCNVAAGDAGEEFIRKLYDITKAQITATATKTGNPKLGGNWNLEVNFPKKTDLAPPVGAKHTGDNISQKSDNLPIRMLRPPSPTGDRLNQKTDNLPIRMLRPSTTGDRLNQKSDNLPIRFLPKGILRPPSTKGKAFGIPKLSYYLNRPRPNALPLQDLATGDQTLAFTAETLATYQGVFAPTLVGTYDTSGSAFAVQVVGNLAYVADDNLGLQIIDITNPTNPIVKGNYNTSGWSRDVQIVGNLAYVADEYSGLQIIDITNPTDPILKCNYHTSNLALDVQIVGNLAYVADEYSGLQIIDITNPTTPILKGNYDTNFVFDVQIVGNLAYVANYDSGLQIIDITNPTTPILKGTYDTSGFAQGVQIVGNLAYVADGASGLQIIDITNPANPILKGNYDTSGYARGVQIVGNLAYVADREGDLKIIDVSEFVPNIITGTAANENFTTTALKQDIIDAQGGDDTITSTFANLQQFDIINGNTGTDTLIITGGTATDTISTDVISNQLDLSGVLGTVSGIERFDLSGFLGTVSFSGGSGDDWIKSGSGDDDLISGDGNDYLNGGLGADLLIGGTGNDTYIVDNVGDFIAEGFNSGIDTVESSITWTLKSHLENLTLTGTAAINGTGNALNNIITGNAGNNTLTGGMGNDTLIGGLGSDTLIGGTGNDTYIVDNVGDVITENLNEGIDTVQSSITWTLVSGNNVENLTLTGTSAINGTGNELNNIIIGNNGNNVLDGGTGNDALKGGLGNDTYYVDYYYDTITENLNEGTDLIYSSIDYHTLSANVENLTLIGSAIYGSGNDFNNIITGNSSNNSLSGYAGNDTLNGGTGADNLYGGLGNDTYIVDDVGDVITENLNQGTDLVQSSITYTLASGNNVENLTLTGTTAINGTGNELNNSITGNAANNTLTGGAGNDTLNGGLGTDTLIGGVGNDVYVVDNVGDIITENLNQGTDTVSVNFTYTLASGNNVENLTLTGTTAINGTGNELNNSITGNAANNILTGGLGNDTLNGGVGADTLIGGVGDDIYTVDNAGDTITENLNEGIDTVNSSITWVLGNNLEKLTLTGTTAINGTGNTADNTITGNNGNNTLIGGDGIDTLTGNAGNDILVGGNGNDILTGGTGADLFRFNASNEGLDNIKDLKVAELDIIQVSASGFGGGLAVGTLTASQFISGAGITSANSSSQRFIYNTTNGALFYDVDGNLAGSSAVQIATLTGLPAITNSHIAIIA
jgi:Ca2+-binding RTX toxin-like protein